jgi:hypothetical protein
MAENMRASQRLGHDGLKALKYESKGTLRL